MKLRLTIIAVLALTFNSSVIADEFIAGIKPYERPANAPVISKVEHDSSWFQNALFGLEPPYPSSFKFLEDQGNWHTPFVKPGMTGRYDIRNWHK